jgi:predicted ArsR family transcriptional regulator
MLDVEVIEDPAAASAALDRIRGRLLAELREPASAAELAGRVGLTRQKVNYHLRTLESHGLVQQAGQRQWGGLTERVLVATAASYAVSPQALGGVGSDPDRTADRLSAGYLIALAGRIVREVGQLSRRAADQDKRLATLAVDTEIAFASAERRAAFAGELTAAVTDLAARYHDPEAPGARAHRLVVGAHPIPRPEEDT